MKEKPRHPYKGIRGTDENKFVHVLESHWEAAMNQILSTVSQDF
jgi:hypothetical protein